MRICIDNKLTKYLYLPTPPLPVFSFYEKELRFTANPEDLASSGQFDQNLDDRDEKQNANIDDRNDDSVFICPTFNDLNKPPKNCNPKKHSGKKYK